MTRGRRVRGWLAIVFVALAGCRSRDDATATAALPEASTSASSAASPGTSPGPLPPPPSSFEAHEHRHDKDYPPVTASVKVSLDDKAVDVVLASVPHDGGAGSIAVFEVLKAAWPDADPARLRFDFVGSDGFRPMSRPKCTRLLTGSETATAELRVATHDLVFEEGSQLPGCYRVHAVVAIEARR